MSDPLVLLIDADADSREICTLLLSHRGFRPVCAGCEVEALDLARRERPAVIVTELYTRTREGWRIPELLRGDPATAGVPLIVLSAHVLPDDRERAFRSGADAFLAKPVDGARLLAEVGRFRGGDRG
ncbi:MAG: response regulator [Gemmatimonadota bacterium]